MKTAITVRYSSIDGFYASRKFVTLAGARKYIASRLGTYYDIGSYYAVSGDGVGKVTVSGTLVATDGSYVGLATVDSVYGDTVPANVK